MRWRPPSQGHLPSACLRPTGKGSSRARKFALVLPLPVLPLTLEQFRFPDLIVIDPNTYSHSLTQKFIQACTDATDAATA